MQKLLFLDETRFTGLFGIADYESENKIPNYKIAGPICESKCKNFLILDESRYSGVFEITDYESELKIHKLKIANLMWRTKIIVT